MSPLLVLVFYAIVQVWRLQWQCPEPVTMLEVLHFNSGTISELSDIASLDDDCSGGGRGINLPKLLTLLNDIFTKFFRC